jgi:hypothetical protein
MYHGIVQNCGLASNILDPKKKNYVELTLPFIGKVCQPFYLAFWGCSRYRLNGIAKDIAETRSVLPTLHGLSGKKSNNKLTTGILYLLDIFLTNLSLANGEAIATRKWTKKKANGYVTSTYENENIIFLPSHFSYMKIYKYFLLCNKLSARDISDRTFENYWKGHEKHQFLKIRSPKKDECDICSIFKTTFTDLTEEEFLKSDD